MGFGDFRVLLHGCATVPVCRLWITQVGFLEETARTCMRARMG